MNFVTAQKIELRTIKKVSSTLKKTTYSYNIIVNESTGLSGVSEVGTNRILIKPAYDKIEYLDQSFFLLTLGDKYGIRDAEEELEFPVPINFDEVRRDISRKEISFFNNKTKENIVFSTEDGVVKKTH